MNSIEFIIDNWEEPEDRKKYEELIKYEEDTFIYSFASLRIEITQDSVKIPITEVEDKIDDVIRVIRPFISVPLYPIALWLLVDWWRIRWEPKQDTYEWHMSHRMSSIGNGWIWPYIEFSSKGDFIQVYSKANKKSGTQHLRYLNDLTIDIPAEQFESAVDKFVNQVMVRLKSYNIENPLQGIIEELSAERADPILSNDLKEQAKVSNYENI